MDNIGIFLCQVRQSLWALTSHWITVIKCERLWAFECFSTREPVKGAHHEPQAAARKQDNYTTGGMQLNTSSFYKALTPQAGCTVWSSTCAAHTFSPGLSELSEMATRLQIAQRSCVSHVNGMITAVAWSSSSAGTACKSTTVWKGRKDSDRRHPEGLQGFRSQAPGSTVSKNRH